MAKNLKCQQMNLTFQVKFKFEIFEIVFFFVFNISSQLDYIKLKYANILWNCESESDKIKKNIIKNAHREKEHTKKIDINYQISGNPPDVRNSIQKEAKINEPKAKIHKINERKVKYITKKDYQIEVEQIQNVKETVEDKIRQFLFFSPREKSNSPKAFQTQIQSEAARYFSPNHSKLKSNEYFLTKRQQKLKMDLGIKSDEEERENPQQENEENHKISEENPKKEESEEKKSSDLVFIQNMKINEKMKIFKPVLKEKAQENISQPEKLIEKKEKMASKEEIKENKKKEQPHNLINNPSFQKEEESHKKKPEKEEKRILAKSSEFLEKKSAQNRKKEEPQNILKSDTIPTKNGHHSPHQSINILFVKFPVYYDRSRKGNQD